MNAVGDMRARPIYSHGKKSGPLDPNSEPLRRVFLITPYRASPHHSRENNAVFLRRCIIDCFGRGEAAFASHRMYTDALNDDDRKERELGMLAGRAFLAVSSAAVCYVDHGVSSGMRVDLQAALATKLPPLFCDEEQPMPIVFRRLGLPAPTDYWLHDNAVPHRVCPLCRMAWEKKSETTA